MAVQRIVRALKGLLRLPDSQAQRFEGLERRLDAQQDILAALGDQALGYGRSQNDDLSRKATLLSDQLNLALHELRILVDRQLEFQRETRLLLGQASRPARDSWPQYSPRPAAPPPGVASSASTVCRQEDMASGLYPYWMSKIGFAPTWHRKRWEFMYVCQALYERGMLRPGMRGLGFGVGEEPLPAYFASAGCKLTLTDLAPEAAAREGWVETEQHAVSREAARRSVVCPDAVFDANVEFRFCDMNAISPDLTGYDFCWSACALEHLGSIDKGLDFIANSLRCLKPGGVAVHTTEFNLSSDEETVSEGSTVLFRRRDLEAFEARMAEAGHRMAPLDLDPGEGVLDRYLDVAPYREEPHLKLALRGYAATSIGLVVQKAG